MEDLEQNGTPGKVGCLHLFTEQEAGHLDESLLWKRVLTSRYADQVGRKVAKEKVGVGVLGAVVVCVELILALA